MWGEAARPPAGGTDGRSILAGGAARMAYGESWGPWFSFGYSPLFVVQTDSERYIRTVRPELYAWREDLDEARDLARTEPDLSERLDSWLDLYKRIIGDALRGRTSATQTREAMVGVLVVNPMTALGTPVSVPVTP